MLIRLLELFIAIAAVRALYYFYYFKRGSHYADLYTIYLSKQDDESSRKLAEVKGQIKQLFRLADLQGVKIPYVEALGFGQLASMNISPSDNLGNLREDVVGVNLRLFEDGVAACRAKSIQSFNPIFWLESLIYLPTQTLSFMGVKGDKFFVKLLQVFWWLFAAVATVVGVVFNQSFVEWFRRVF